MGEVGAIPKQQYNTYRSPIFDFYKYRNAKIKTKLQRQCPRLWNKHEIMSPIAETLVFDCAKTEFSLDCVDQVFREICTKQTNVTDHGEYKGLIITGLPYLSKGFVWIMMPIGYKIKY